MVRNIVIFLLCLASCEEVSFTNVSSSSHHIRTPEHKGNKLQATNRQMEWQDSAFTNVHTCISTAEKIAYLTFDDGPSQYTEELLDSLSSLNVKATFFMVGTGIKKYPNIVKRIIKEGHGIGNHTYDHQHLSKLTDEQVIDEFHSVEELLDTDLPIVRIPWGNIKDRQIRLLKNKEIYHWSINTDDWYFNKKEYGVDSIYHRIIDYIHPGAIILAHDGGGDRRKTIISITGAIRTLQNQGWHFKTL